MNYKVAKISPLNTPVFRLSLHGTDYEIGRQRGIILAEDLHHMWDWMEAHMASAYKLPRDKWAFAAKKASECFSFSVPWLLEQIEGMHDGSQLDMEKLLLMNNYGVIWTNNGNWCSSVAIRYSDEGGLVWQNLDLGAEDFYYMEETHPSSACAILSGAMTAICSYPCGINNHGLAVASSNLPAPGQRLQPWEWQGLPYLFLPFVVLRQCRKVKEAIDYIKSLPPSIPSGGGYQLNLMDSSGDMAVIDRSGHRTIVRQCDANLNFTTNCSLSSEMESWRLGSEGENSDAMLRVERIRKEWAKLQGAVPTRTWLKELLAEDKESGALCRTNERGFTRQSFIFSPGKLTMDIANGPPNRNEYKLCKFRD